MQPTKCPAPVERTVLEDAARGCRITYEPGFLSAADADALFAALHRDTPFEREAPVMFGRPVEVRRRTFSYGEPGVRYRYSGVERVASPWHEALVPLVEALTPLTGVRFNYALCQLYPDGEAGIGWHADKERDIVADTPIASLSLGAERDFQVRLGNRGAASRSVRLAHGSLLVMGGATQRHYQHRVPKAARCRAPRINLTFRVVRAPGPSGSRTIARRGRPTSRLERLEISFLHPTTNSTFYAEVGPTTTGEHCIERLVEQGFLTPLDPHLCYRIARSDGRRVPLGAALASAGIASGDPLLLVVHDATS